MELTTAIEMISGQVVKTTCTAQFPCWHLAILIYDPDGWFVYQNTPGLKNKFGGNVVRQPAKEFFEKREILEVYERALCPEIVRRHAWEKREKKWSGLYYNCEDFVNEIFIGQKGSDLRNRYVLGGLIAIGLLVK